MKNKALLGLVGVTVLVIVVALIADITDTAPTQTATTTDERVVATSTTVSTTSTTTEEGEVTVEPTLLPIPPGTTVAPAPQVPAPVKPAVISAPQSSSVVLLETKSQGIVTAATVKLAKAGYVVIYRTNSNEKTELVGYSDLLPPGSYLNVPVQLSSPVARKQVVTAVLHEDDGDGKFEFPVSDFYLKNGSRLVYDEDVVEVPIVEEAGLVNGTVEAHLEDAKNNYVPD